jgi:hypothetical protein
MMSDWDDYDSAQMFPGCECGHDATEHAAAWSEHRKDAQGGPLTGCALCACGAEWEHA